MVESKKSYVTWTHRGTQYTVMVDSLKTFEFESVLINPQNHLEHSQTPSNKKNMALLENIQKNESYLTKDYQNELIEMYKEKLLVYVENFIGRNHYVKACTYLRQMKKIGGNEEAEALVEIFRKKYPQRKALLDELNLV